MSRAGTWYRTVCAALAVATGIYAAYGSLATLVGVLLSGGIRTLVDWLFCAGALACLGAAIWAAALARGGRHQGFTLVVGLLGGLVLAGMTAYLVGGEAPPRPPRTTIGLAFIGVQVAAVPVLAWLRAGLPNRPTRGATAD